MKKDTPTLGKAIEIDEVRIKDHLGELVRGSVEDTLNTLLDAGADQIGHEVIRRDAEDARSGVGSHKEKGPVGPVSL